MPLPDGLLTIATAHTEAVERICLDLTDIDDLTSSHLADIRVHKDIHLQSTVDLDLHMCMQAQVMRLSQPQYNKVNHAGNSLLCLVATRRVVLLSMYTYSLVQVAYEALQQGACVHHR
jgi:hypothetical protein